MSSISSYNSRTTGLMLSNKLLAVLQDTQAKLSKAQDAISTGKSVNKPSDAPAKLAAILLLQQALNARTQHEDNLNFANSLLNNVDSALGDASSLVLEAKSIGSSQIGIGSTTDTRKNQATVLDAQLQSLLDIANRQTQGISLFGGNATRPSTGTAQPQFVYVDSLGGVQYLGSDTNLTTEVGANSPIAFNTNGQEAFSALSSRVLGDRDLNPQTKSYTLLSDLNGANQAGIRKGSVQLTVGATMVNVDLNTADSLNDVVARVNDAITTLDPTAGTLAVGTNGLTLTANAGKTITLADTAGGYMASDLGIATTASGATVTGTDVGVRLTSRTKLADWGVGVDFTSGLKITQGAVTKIADFSSATTVEDLQNVISGLGLGVRLEVNQAGTGLNILNQMSGPAMSIGEVSGGSTATDLGLRSLGLTTQLTDFNFGLGINNVQGQPDLGIRLHDGSYADIKVNIDGAQTVDDVITAIKAAATAVLGAGNVGNPGDAGTLFNIGLAADGNGLKLEDNTSGANSFVVSNLGTSLTATDLGIAKNAGNGATITGDDNAQVRTESVFTHLLSLRDSLTNDDSRGITLATSALETDSQKLDQARAAVGVRGQRVNDQQQLSAAMKLSEQSMLSDLQDTDMTSTLMQYTQLTTQLQAAMKVGAQNMQMSLLDFLK